MVSNRIIRQRNAEFARTEKARQEAARTLQSPSRANTPSIKANNDLQRISSIFLPDKEIAIPPFYTKFPRKVSLSQTQQYPCNRGDLNSLKASLPNLGEEVTISLPDDNEPIMTGKLAEVNFEQVKLPISRLTKLNKDGSTDKSPDDEGAFVITVEGSDSKRKFSTYDIPFTVSW